jgi:hypothetical protein
MSGIVADRAAHTFRAEAPGGTKPTPCARAPGTS